MFGNDKSQHAGNNYVNYFGIFGSVRMDLKSTQKRPKYLIIVGTKQNLHNLPPITVNFMGTGITGSPSVKKLGVTFDQNLTFTDHVTDVARRCTGVLSGLSRCRHAPPRETLTTLVQALAASSIRYCISVYGVCGVAQRARLQKLLNFRARVVSGRRKYDHISDVLKELQWLSAEN